MDRRERLNDPEEATRIAQDGHQAQIWTSLPGIILSFDADRQTAEVQCAIQGIFQAKDGSFTNKNMTVLSDVPIEFPSGGGFTLTFPIAAGDECMIDVSARCIDSWWQSGGVQTQAEQRMHDLSDSICRVGVRSQARKLADISTNSVQLRADDGSSYIDMAAGQITVVHPTKITIQSPTVEFTGNVTIDGDLTAKGTVKLNTGAQAVKLADGSNATKVTAT